MLLIPYIDHNELKIDDKIQLTYLISLIHTFLRRSIDVTIIWLTS